MLASPQSTLAAAPLAAPAAPAVAVATPMQAPEWRDAVAERVTLLVRDRVHAAELHVNPPELGPVSVRIDVSGSDAAVVFGAQHAETRNLLTEALPRLAEALAAGGITLSGAQVGAEFQPQRDRSDDAPRGGNGEQKASDAQPTKVIARGLIDVFA
jgi:flagellar hook-length control protein FliK